MIKRKALDEEVRSLRADFSDFLDRITVKTRTKQTELRAARFLSQFYEIVIDPPGPMAIGTVQDFAAQLGRIPDAEKLDAPPYTEILMQGFRGMAFRHPEYMLARDVEFLYDAFWQAEDLVRDSMDLRTLPLWHRIAAENVQGLARATILSCFSLLESTVSGLAKAFVMTSPHIRPEVRKQLVDNHKPLLERLLLVPTLITGRPTQLTANSTPLLELFGAIKQRRDAFMHCEPGEHESRPGFRKQERFHDVRAPVVDQSIALTVSVVRTLWRHVHDVEVGPVWLRQLGHRSSYRRGLRLVPAEELNAAVQTGSNP
jgi:hypothetical protein